MTTPRPDPDEVDSRFRAIMDAEFGQPLEPASDPAAPVPLDRPVSPVTPSPPIPLGTTPPVAPGEPFNLTEAMDRVEPDEPEEPFQAPEPGPLPRPTGRAAAGAVLTALSVACFLADLMGVTLVPALGMVAIGGFAVGLALLLSSVPREPRDPWDDGSRV